GLHPGIPGVRARVAESGVLVRGPGHGLRRAAGLWRGGRPPREVLSPWRRHTERVRVRTESGMETPMTEAPHIPPVAVPKPPLPPGVNPSKPSPARLYDYYLGGHNNFEVDRKAAEVLRLSLPALR